MKFRKKPVVIEAVQFSREAAHLADSWTYTVIPDAILTGDLRRVVALLTWMPEQSDAETLAIMELMAAAPEMLAILRRAVEANAAEPHPPLRLDDAAALIARLTPPTAPSTVGKDVRP